MNRTNIAGKDYPFYRDDNGVDRFFKNSQNPLLSKYRMDGEEDEYDLRRMCIDFQCGSHRVNGLISFGKKREYLEAVMALGYSVDGLYDTVAMMFIEDESTTLKNCDNV